MPNHGSLGRSEPLSGPFWSRGAWTMSRVNKLALFGVSVVMPLGAAVAQAQAPQPAATQVAKPAQVTKPPASAPAKVDPIAPLPEGTTQPPAEALPPPPPPPPPFWRPD